MTVRDRAGRTRYIGFVLESARRVSREEVVRELEEKLRHRGERVLIQLTVYDGNRGILKVPHKLKAEAIMLLDSLRSAGRDQAPVRVRTVVTSGTICTVKERMGIPPGRPPPQHAARRRHDNR